MSLQRSTFLTLAAASLAAAAPAPASARAAEQWAAPDDQVALMMTAPACSQLAACSLQQAVARAEAGDTIVVRAGRHQVDQPLGLREGVDIVGEAGAATVPAIVGSQNLGGPTLTVTRGTIVGVTVEARSATQPALALHDGGTVEDVTAIAAGGPGLAVDAHKDRALLRDSVIVSRGTSTSVAALQIQGKKDVPVRNLTVWAPDGAGGVRCNDVETTTTLVNTLVRGAFDVDGAASCSVAHSAVRPERTSGVTVKTGNVSADPLLADPANLDLRPLTGSSTIDAGTDDPLLGATDPDGRARKLGGAVDVGAYEWTESAPPAPQPQPQPEPPAPTPTDDKPDKPGKSGEDHGKSGEEHGKKDKDKTPATPATPADPQAGTPAQPAAPASPALGKKVVLDEGSGKVKVKLPGTSKYVDLADAASLPVGTTVDATAGTVTLTTALPGGQTQSGTFRGGAFTVRQMSASKGMTDIVLTGGSFAGCAKTRATARKAAAPTATAASAKKKRRTKAVRKLWASDEGGRFRTHGAESVTTVRGTSWLTEDRCDGTYTKVTDGAVDVRSKRTGKVTRVKAGRSLLVPRR